MKETLALTRPRNFELYVPTADLKNAAGEVILKKGTRITTANKKKLEEAGVTTVEVVPANPTEIACAQLCGLNHYRMKGFVNILPEADFKKWYAEAVEEQQE
jgi:hypothetical protein